MNTNRSDKLGSSKALKQLGPRKGFTAYKSVQQVRAYQKLAAASVVPNVRMAAAFNKVARAAKGAIMDFHEFARFLHHGPVHADLSVQHSMYGPMTGYFQFYDTGSPGVSVQDLKDLALQYKYLHPK